MNDLDEGMEVSVKESVEPVARKVALSQEQVDLLQRTVCKDHTADEIQLFMQYCQAKGLDPFGREIYSIKRSGRVTFQISIDALRMKAEDTNEYNGQETHWCDENGKWVDVWVSALPPFAARVSVYRKGIDKPFVGIALWTEYKPADNDFIWKKMPSNQLAKCAEAIALRKAFPRKLGGLYAGEEMEQADKGGTSKPKIAMPKAKAVSEHTETQAVEEHEPLDDVFREAPPEYGEPPVLVYTEPPVGMNAENVAAMEAQKPLDAPKSKYFTMLHKVVREKKVPEEKMKRTMKLLFNVESSKELDDKQCADLIKLVEKGGVK